MTPTSYYKNNEFLSYAECAGPATDGIYQADETRPDSVEIFPYKIGGCAAPCMAIAVNDSGAIGGGIPVPGIKEFPETVRAQVRHLSPIKADVVECSVLHAVLYQGFYKMMVHVGGNHSHRRVLLYKMFQQSAV